MQCLITMVIFPVTYVINVTHCNLRYSASRLQINSNFEPIKLIELKPDPIIEDINYRVLEN